jgi:hypothetical protein
MWDYFTADQLELLAASVVRCNFLVAFDFLSGAEYVWNGNTPFTVGGKTYKPMFGLGEIEGLGLSGGTTSRTVTLSLNGLPNGDPDFLAAALTDTAEVDQRMVTISLQLFDEDWQPIGLPVPLFRGFMQPPNVSRTEIHGVEGAVQSIVIAAEDVFFGRSRPPHGRNTDRDQQARSPGDKFFGFVASLVSKTLRYPDF